MFRLKSQMVTKMVTNDYGTRNPLSTPISALGYTPHLIVLWHRIGSFR
jgi:hypothetical protein